MTAFGGPGKITTTARGIFPHTARVLCNDALDALPSTSNEADDVTDRNRSRIRLALTAALTLGVMAPASLFQAASAAEPRDPIQRADIALIEKQLQRIDRVINRLAARQQQQAGRRVILDVDRLRSDVNDVRNGLRAYLAPPRLPPRQPAPLSGQYLAQNPGANP